MVIFRKRYSLEEIDKMRSALWFIHCIQDWGNPGAPCWIMNGGPKPDRIEDELRTHMQNGTPVSDLCVAANRKIWELNKYESNQTRPEGQTYHPIEMLWPR
jgi:hypothetical protein